MDNANLAGQLISFNYHVALDQVGGDEGLLREVVELFLNEYPALVAQMEQAIRLGDPRLLQAAAHTLKGSLGTLGAQQAHSHAFELEVLGKRNEMTAAPELCRSLKGQLAILHEQLTAITA